VNKIDKQKQRILRKILLKIVQDHLQNNQTNK